MKYILGKTLYVIAFLFEPYLIAFILILIVGSSLIANAQNPKTHIPPRAFEYRDVLYDEINTLIPDLPEYNFVPSLIEHESCISLTHSKCWSPNSELRNSREHSIGFFQIARAFNANGTTRMDTLGSLKSKYKTLLKDANWNNLAKRPDLQIRAGMLLIHDNWRYLSSVKDPYERIYFTDAAHNAGAGRMDKDRRLCGLTEGCDPQKWFGNVEKACTLSTKPIPNYGNRSFCDINRGHVKDVMQYRLPKYKNQYFNEEYIANRKEENK